MKTYKKADCEEETECIDLTQSQVKFGAKAKQFIIVLDKETEFIFCCCNGKESNEWVEQIWNTQKSAKNKDAEVNDNLDDMMMDMEMESVIESEYDPQPWNPY